MGNKLHQQSQVSDLLVVSRTPSFEKLWIKLQFSDFSAIIHDPFILLIEFFLKLSHLSNVPYIIGYSPS